MAMFSIIFLTVSFVLLIGFSVLAWYEKSKEWRFLDAKRVRLDKNVERVQFIIANVDLAAFAREEARRVLARLGHDVVHFSLRTVRAVEHALTRLVRHLRTQHAVEVRSAAETREFVKTLSDFKDRLKSTQLEVSNVQ